MSYKLLDGINSPSDLKKLNKSSVSALAQEIRDFLIESTERNGGHLASNLGVVELTLAIHTVFDSPKDHIIFDVGHQSYVHKILTGRREEFVNLRKSGGLSGFTKRDESVHDPFGAGHSSTSISAALGLAEADKLAGRKSYTVCVTGDGAYTGGMVHEALNNCQADLPMIIILNENGMSISTNKGAFASYLSRVRVSGGYRNLKSRTQGILGKIPLVGRPLRFVISKLKNATKSIVYKPNYFELLGLYYVGPVDGNDYTKLCEALDIAKQTGKTCVVHVKTQKGRGYSPAEASPDDYHSVSSSKQSDSYHSVMGEKLLSLAKDDEEIVAVTAAMGIGTGLSSFGEKYPDRYYDVGIAEAHAMTFSAGLAAGGLKPFIGIYSTFMQRCYDNILHDVCLQKLPVRILVDRAGLAPGDGATHHGIFDVSFLSHIPEMTILAPASYSSLCNMIDFARDFDGPIAIRYPNAAEQPGAMEGMKSVGNRECRIFTDYDNTPEYVFVTYGHLLSRVREAERILRDSGHSVGVILVESLKPYAPSAELIMKLTKGASRVLYAEEGIKAGGAAEITRGELIKLGLDLSLTDYRIAAIDDNFASPKELCDLYDYVGLSAQKLAEHMLK